MESFGQTHQSHPKLPVWLVCLEDSLPSDMATEYQAQAQQLSAFFVNKNWENENKSALQSGSQDRVQTAIYPSEMNNK